MNQTQMKYIAKRINEAVDAKSRSLKVPQREALSKDEVESLLKSVGLSCTYSNYIYSLDAHERFEKAQREYSSKYVEIRAYGRKLLDKLYLSGNDGLIEMMEKGLKELENL